MFFFTIGSEEVHDLADRRRAKGQNSLSDINPTGLLFQSQVPSSQAYPSALWDCQTNWSTNPVVHFTTKQPMSGAHLTPNPIPPGKQTGP
ncbi:unnamed protein product [Camellia sinensis]